MPKPEAKSENHLSKIQTACALIVIAAVLIGVFWLVVHGIDRFMHHSRKGGKKAEVSLQAASGSKEMVSVRQEKSKDAADIL